MPKRDAIITLIAKNKLRRPIADRCQITIDAVKKWPRVPPRHAQSVAQITGIPCHKIRPDIFPNPASEEPSNG